MTSKKEGFEDDSEQSQAAPVAPTTQQSCRAYHIWREQEGDPEAPIAPGSIAQLDSKRRLPYIPLLDVNWYRQFKKTLEAKA